MAVKKSILDVYQKVRSGSPSKLSQKIDDPWQFSADLSNVAIQRPVKSGVEAKPSSLTAIFQKALRYVAPQ